MRNGFMPDKNTLTPFMILEKSTLTPFMPWTLVRNVQIIQTSNICFPEDAEG